MTRILASMLALTILVSAGLAAEPPVKHKLCGNSISMRYRPKTRENRARCRTALQTPKSWSPDRSPVKAGFVCPAPFLALLEQRRFEDAWTCALSECKRNPDSPDGWLLRSQVLAAQNRLVDAIAEATIAAQHFPRSPDVFFVRAGYHSTCLEWMCSLEDIDRAVALGRSVDAVRALRAAAYLGLNRPAEAEAEFRIIVAGDRSPKIISGYIHALLQQGKFREAELLAKKLVAALPKSAEARYCVAQVLWARGDREGAIQKATEAIQLSPSQADLWGMRSAFHSMLKEWQNASEDASTAIRLAKTNRDRATYHFERAHLHCEQAQLLEAVGEVTAAIESDPQWATYQHFRADVLFRLKRFKEARDDLDHVIADAKSDKPQLIHALALSRSHRRRATINLFLGDQAAYEADRAEAERLENEEASKEAIKP